MSSRWTLNVAQSTDSNGSWQSRDIINSMEKEQSRWENIRQNLTHDVNMKSVQVEIGRLIANLATVAGCTNRPMLRYNSWSL